MSDMPHPSHGETVRINKKTFSASCPQCGQVLMHGHPLRGGGLTLAAVQQCPAWKPTVAVYKKFYRSVTPAGDVQPEKN